MTRRRAATRAAAIRRAQQAKAQRDAERLAREQQIEATLADYFEAISRAATIRAEARGKADKLLADAETAAGQPETAGRNAVRRLRTLTGSHTDVAELCGLTVPAVRTMLRGERPEPPSQPGPGAHAPAGEPGHLASPDPAQPGR